MFFIKQIIISLILIFLILITISFFTLTERKVLAGIQRRHGPVIIGFFGLLQPFADGLKLILKEISIPAGGYYYIFILSSIFSLCLSLISWSVIPFNSNFVISDINYGLIFILVISSLNVYSIMFAGWSSNSKYALLGSIRSGAQMVSYEIPMSFSLIPILLFSASANLTNIINYQINNFYFFIFFPFLIIFFITALAETNRTPFDLPEAESELVAGYNMEYSSLPFAFFFLAEYNHILLMSVLITILFFGGWGTLSCFFFSNNYILKNIFETFILILKSIFIVLLFISIRASVPRYKYTDLLSMCWLVFIPFLIFLLLLLIFIWIL